MRTVLLGLDILVKMSGGEVIVRQVEAELECLEVLNKSEDNN